MLMRVVQTRVVRTQYSIYAFSTSVYDTQVYRVVSSNPVHDEVYLIQHYVIKVVSDLRQAGGFLRVLRFPPPIKLTATIQDSQNV
jgi:hypothetical protein